MMMMLMNYYELCSVTFSDDVGLFGGPPSRKASIWSRLSGDKCPGMILVYTPGNRMIGIYISEIKSLREAD